MQLGDYNFDNDKEIFQETPRLNFINYSICSKKNFSKQNLELHQIFQHILFLFKCPKNNCNRSFFKKRVFKGTY
jgi:hypothetical protein